MSKYVNTKEFQQYEIKNFYINEEKKIISGILTYFYFNNMSVTSEEKNFLITNLNKIIIDPNWHKYSTPAKPDGFNIDILSTWAHLMSYEDIPKIIEERFQYFSKVINSNNIKMEILNALINLEILPKGEDWRFVN